MMCEICEKRPSATFRGVINVCIVCAVEAGNAPIDSGCRTEDDGVHVYAITEVHTGCTVVVTHCACGKQDISWHHGAPNEREREMKQTCERCMSHMVPS
jgi:hypothetical protein